MLTDFEREMNYGWFLRNYPKFYRAYNGLFLAIKNCEVVGVFSSAGNAVKAGALGEVIVQEVNGEYPPMAYINFSDKGIHIEPQSNTFVNFSCLGFENQFDENVV